MNTTQKTPPDQSAKKRIERFTLIYGTRFCREGVRAQLKAAAVISQIIDFGESSIQKSTAHRRFPLLEKVNCEHLRIAYELADFITVLFGSAKNGGVKFDVSFCILEAPAHILLKLSFTVQRWGHISQIDRESSIQLPLN